MNRLYIIVIAILCFAATPVAIAGDIIKHYDEGEVKLQVHHEQLRKRLHGASGN